MAEPTNKQQQVLSDGVLGEDRQLPDTGHKVDRISEHAKGLVDDVRDWVDLKVKLVQVEIEDKIDAKLNQTILALVLALVMGLVLVFSLTALALGLGTWLGHDAWGFLAVASILGLFAGGLQLVKPRLVKKRARPPANKTDVPSTALTKTEPKS